MTVRDSAPDSPGLGSKSPKAGSRMRKHPEKDANRAKASKRRQRFRLFEANRPMVPESRSLTAPATH
jgi:hypothetical protein